MKKDDEYTTNHVNWISLHKFFMAIFLEAKKKSQIGHIVLSKKLCIMFEGYPFY